MECVLLSCSVSLYLLQIGVIKYGKEVPPEKTKPVMRASDMEVTYKPKDLMVKFEVLPLQPQPGDLTITTESRLKPGLGYEDGRFYDTETGQYMSISEAIERGLIVIDWESGMVINKYTNEVNYHKQVQQ